MQLDPLTSKSDKHLISPYSITLPLGSLELKKFSTTKEDLHC